MTSRIVRTWTLLAWLVGCVAAYGCSSSSSGGGGGNPSGDAGVSDAAHPRDSSPVEDHAVIDAAAPEAGGGDDGGVDAGPTCAPPTSKGTACASCVTSNCEAAWCTCKEDPDNVDDAGDSGCLRYVACAEECVASDAGTPTACLQQICSTLPFSKSEEDAGQSLVDCLVQYCAADCVD